MYCPVCRVEYREGFSRCAACDVDLVSELPAEPEPEYVETVTVFEGDADCAAVARARLEAAGIESWTTDEGVHGLFPSLGGTDVEVRVEDEKRALDALDASEGQEPVTQHGDRAFSKRSPGVPTAGKGIAPGAPDKEGSNTRKQDHATPKQSHHPEDHRRSGKRV